MPVRQRGLELGVLRYQLGAVAQAAAEGETVVPRVATRVHDAQVVGAAPAAASHQPFTVGR